MLQLHIEADQVHVARRPLFKCGGRLNDVVQSLFVSPHNQAASRADPVRRTFPPSTQPRVLIPRDALGPKELNRWWLSRISKLRYDIPAAARLPSCTLHERA